MGKRKGLNFYKYYRYRFLIESSPFTRDEQESIVWDMIGEIESTTKHIFIYTDYEKARAVAKAIKSKLIIPPGTRNIKKNTIFDTMFSESEKRGY